MTFQEQFEKLVEEKIQSNDGTINALKLGGIKVENTMKGLRSQKRGIEDRIKEKTNENAILAKLKEDVKNFNNG